MNFNQSWMKKYRIIINMTNNAITFWFGHYTHTKAFFLITLDQAISLIEIMLLKTTQDIISNKIIKRGFYETVNTFLKIPDKISIL